MKQLLILLGVILLVGTASAVTWNSTSGCWTATDGSDTLVMWNATGNFTYVIPQEVTTISQYFVGAAGGNGGNGVVAADNGGGGGAGGVVNGSSFSVTPGSLVNVSVGNYTPAKGQNSSFDSLIANGGGTGGSSAVGGNGGSGGGGAFAGYKLGGSGTSGQGNNGGAGRINSPYPAGGGGGAGQAGNTSASGRGGNGLEYFITGTSSWYGGGGSGAQDTPVLVGGSGGGGNGAIGTGAGTWATAGGVNTGGGGGGGASATNGNIAGANGGSGLVIIRYTTPVAGNYPIPSFTSDVVSGYEPLAVQFNDTSITSPSAWNWSFTNVTPGNNTQVWWSTTQNATWTFYKGNWNINLNVTNSSGYNVSTSNYWVNVSPRTVTANFTCSPLSLQTSELLSCTDTSTTAGSTITNWSWTFEDSPSNTTNTTQNATKTYTSNGVWDVTLSVYNATAGYNNLTKSNYVTVSDSGALTGWNRQDIVLDEIYTLSLTFKDAASLADIPVVNVTDNFGSNVTTSIGTASFQYNYTAVVIYAVSSGYYGKSTSYIVSGDRSETIYLTRESSVANVSVPVSQIYPHYVTFHVKEGWGTALADVNITVLGVSTSTGNWDWIVTLLGVPLDEVPINGTLMTQTTDTMGMATFYMIPTGKYNLTFTKAGYTIPSMVLVPQDEDYIIWVTGTDSPYYRYGQDELSAVNITVNNIPFNASYNYLNLTYYDSTGHTTGGYIDVLQKNATPGGLPTTLAHWHVTNSSFTESVGVSHPIQISGYVNTNVTHTDFGQIKRSYPFQMNSVPVSFLGFGAEIAMIVALGMMLFTAMLGGATHARQVVFVVVIEAVVFYTMHWFQPLIDRGVPDAAIVLALGLMAVVAIAANMEVRKKREKY